MRKPVKENEDEAATRVNDAIDMLTDLRELYVQSVADRDAALQDVADMEEEISDLRRRPEPDDELATAFEHASRAFSESDVLFVGREGDEGPIHALCRVGGTPLTLGDLLRAIPSVRAG